MADETNDYREHFPPIATDNVAAADRFMRTLQSRPKSASCFA
jgi:hypothetical protein